jgi:hypothetical protein
MKSGRTSAWARSAKKSRQALLVRVADKDHITGDGIATDVDLVRTIESELGRQAHCLAATIHKQLCSLVGHGWLLGYIQAKYIQSRRRCPSGSGGHQAGY